jgi:Tol biopolymer transport system component/streptogramin lyase
MRGRPASCRWIGAISAGLILAWIAVAPAPAAGAPDFLVTSLNTSQVLRYDDATGAPLGAFVAAGSGGLDEPRGLALGPDGRLYVAKSLDSGASAILRYDGTTGAFIDTFVAAPSGGLNIPHTILFGPDGHLYVANEGTNSVLRYHGTTGDFLGTFATFAAGGLTTRGGMVFGPDGHLYVSQLTNRAVLRFNGITGAFIDAFVEPRSGGLCSPRGLRFGPDGHLYVASSARTTGDVPDTNCSPLDSAPNSILRYDGTTGRFLSVFVPPGGGGIAGAALNGPYDLLFAPDGRLYVTSFGNDQIRRYDGTTGAFVDVFVPTNSGGLDGPVEMALLVRRPVASAGPDQTVAEGALVVLDGSASSDPDGLPLRFSWTQVGGPAVNLGAVTTATPSFVAPELAAGQPVTFTFQVVVDNGTLSSPAATVRVTVGDTVRLLRPLSDGLGGAPPDGAALNPSLSADGRFVVFQSTSTNLVASGCITGESQIFLRDRVTGTVVCLSIAPNGAPGNGSSARPAISADGRFVVFESAARNLTPGPCDTPVVHIFIRDLTANTTSCVSIATGGAAADAASSAPAVSGDGRLVVFASLAANLGCPGGIAQIYLRDQTAGTTVCLTVGLGAAPGNGPSGRPAISTDGRFVAFESAAQNLVAAGCVTVNVQIFVHDRLAGTRVCASLAPDGVTPGNADSATPVLSANGSVLAFASLAINLAGPCTTVGIAQIFVRQLASGTTQCITVGPDGSPGNGPSSDPAISASGLTVVFTTLATNLTAPGVVAATRGGPPHYQPGTTGTIRWQDSAALRDPMTALLDGAGTSGDRSTAMSGDGSIVVSEVLSLSGSAALAAIEEVPAPPVGQPLIVAPAPGTAFALVGAIPLTFQWTAVTNAAGYRLVVSGPVGGAVDLGPATSQTVTLSPGLAPPGAYQLQVIPLGADGTPGTPSAPLAFSLIPSIALQPGDRPYFITPEAEVTVARGQGLTFAWTTLAGVALHGIEVTGADLVFQNPNGTVPDGQNGFGGAGGGGLVSGTSVTIVVPNVPAGRYQVRVIGISAAGAVVGSFSDAVTVIVVP